MINLLVIFALLFTFSGCSSKQDNEGSIMPQRKPTIIGIILGSTREGRSSDKIAKNLKEIANKRDDIVTEIIDLKDYNLPFFNEATPPASREKITDLAIKKWSEKIREMDAFVIVLPEYNSGYPGVLKNAMDSLYKEWNNKPVGFVGYSGGPSGATSAISQMRQVAQAFQMIPVSTEIKIPSAWKAFDEKGNLVKNIEQEFNDMIDQIIES